MHLKQSPINANVDDGQSIVVVNVHAMTMRLFLADIWQPAFKHLTSIEQPLDPHPCTALPVVHCPTPVIDSQVC